MAPARHPRRVVGMVAMPALDFWAPGSSDGSARDAPRGCTRRVLVIGTPNSVSFIIHGSAPDRLQGLEPSPTRLAWRGRPDGFRP